MVTAADMMLLVGDNIFLLLGHQRIGQVYLRLCKADHKGRRDLIRKIDILPQVQRNANPAKNIVG